MLNLKELKILDYFSKLVKNCSIKFIGKVFGRNKIRSNLPATHLPSGNCEMEGIRGDHAYLAGPWTGG
jgi:hypothetical protein